MNVERCSKKSPNTVKQVVVSWLSSCAIYTGKAFSLWTCCLQFGNRIFKACGMIAHIHLSEFSPLMLEMKRV